jgi:hypothetical protein
VLLVYAANLWARKYVPRKSTLAASALFLCFFGTTNYYFLLKNMFFRFVFSFSGPLTPLWVGVVAAFSRCASTRLLASLCPLVCVYVCVCAGTVYRSASEWRCASRVQTLAEERHELSSFRVYSTARASGEALCLSGSLSLLHKLSLSASQTLCHKLSVDDAYKARRQPVN